MPLTELSQILGNVGEFVGAIAVVATLFYLAVQVRYGREATEPNTRSLDQSQKVATAQMLQARVNNRIQTARWFDESDHLMDIMMKLRDAGARAFPRTGVAGHDVDVVLSDNTSRTLDAIENPTDASVIWIMLLQYRDRSLSEHGAPAFKEAFDALRNEPRYQRALLRYGIDDGTLAKVQVHTNELWD